MRMFGPAPQPPADSRIYNERRNERRNSGTDGSDPIYFAHTETGDWHPSLGNSPVVSNGTYFSVDLRCPMEYKQSCADGCRDTYLSRNCQQAL
jgi:hypothetical protein